MRIWHYYSSWHLKQCQLHCIAVHIARTVSDKTSAAKLIKFGACKWMTKEKVQNMIEYFLGASQNATNYQECSDKVASMRFEVC